MCVVRVRLCTPALGLPFLGLSGWSEWWVSLAAITVAYVSSTPFVLKRDGLVSGEQNQVLKF